MYTELATIANDINQEHQLSINSANTAIEHAHKTGELLTEAKAQVKHGEWNDWILNNCQFSTRTAQAYMQLSKAQLSADLTIDETLRLMAEPKEKTLEENEAIIENGLAQMTENQKQEVFEHALQNKRPDDLTASGYREKLKELSLDELAAEINTLEKHDQKIKSFLDKATQSNKYSSDEKQELLKEAAILFNEPELQPFIQPELLKEIEFQRVVFCEQMKKSSEKIRIAMLDDASYVERIRIIAFELAAGRISDGTEYGKTMESIHEWECHKGGSATERLIADTAKSIPAKYHHYVIM